MSVLWNPWHGCHKLSAGCAHCYVYRIDDRNGRDPSEVKKTANFGLPLRKKRNGEYTVPPGSTVYTCFTSDFLLDDADEWRIEAWQMMKLRRDICFFFITKRIDRFAACAPDDWGEGYDNVHLCCTVENQDRADYRLPIFSSVPAKYKSIVCEPLLGPIHLEPWLDRNDFTVQEVLVGGESGPEARICDYRWVLDLKEQCVSRNISFCFRQTGARLLKDGKLYRIKKQMQHSQARKAGLNFRSENRSIWRWEPPSGQQELDFQ
ncbi:MAG: phage Gp37/Gp68 family protein [Spirochaetaceae bacterium]|jgi:protein gp37|nr:phage Gp37/Gp68 family protein [Spirochaetaceae bacterium]